VPASFLGRAARGIEDFIRPIYRWVGYGGAVVVALVSIAMVYSAIGRYVDHPLNGSGDIIELGFLVMIALAIGIEHMGHEKMTVDAVARLLPKKVQAWLQPIIFVLVLAILVVVVWQLVKHGFRFYERGEKTPGTLHLPRWPFAFIIAFGMFTLIPIYVARLLESLDRLVKR
jgi:TRAP-type C4-dicarboxylate transport system permease small subunit